VTEKQAAVAAGTSLPEGVFPVEAEVRGDYDIPMVNGVGGMYSISARS
jgi:hypothetical protein